MIPIQVLRRIAEIEFSHIVVQTDLIGAKLRVFLVDSSYVDVWASQKLSGRFGFHWERRHTNGCTYRYDNFPDTDWASVPTFPYHFHTGSQSCVIASPFSHSVEAGFRDFMSFVVGKMRGQDSK